MRKKIATTLRHAAEEKTIGQSKSATRRLYRKFKKGWKDEHKVIAHPKFKLSKRQQRLIA